MKIFVGMTGASGAVYGLRLIQELDKINNVELHISITPDAYTNIELETELGKISDYNFIDKLMLDKKKTFIHNFKNFAAPVSSGSFKIDKYIVCPASMGVIGRVASGVSSNLIERCADVAMKEYRDLVLVFREMPLNQIHLENLLKLARAGAKILPAAPGFYHSPKKIEDIILFVVGKIFDIISIEHSFFKRWGIDYEDDM
jgi:4-hydroxy-3-polyprenylbenzoate decarboxylase